MKIAVTALSAITGLSTASPYLSSADAQLGIGLNPEGFGSANTTIDLTGINSWDAFGDADNEFLSGFIGAFSHVIAIGWKVTIETQGASWLSEPVMDIQGELILTPGIGTDSPGTASFSSGGMFDLVGSGLDFFVGADGLLNIEFFESYDDVDGAIDATFLPGSKLYIQHFLIPTPSTPIIFGLGALVATRRRR